MPGAPFSDGSLFEPAVGPFDQKTTAPLFGKGIVEQAFRQGRVQVRLGIRRITLRPYQIQFRTGLIFPADDEVGAELDKIEIRLGKTVIGISVCVFIHEVTAVLKTDFLAVKDVKPLIVPGGLGL